MRPTTVTSKVTVFVDGKPHEGTIVDVITQGAARIELAKNRHVLADYALTGADGTFHYPGEKLDKSAAKSAPAATPATA